VRKAFWWLGFLMISILSMAIVIGWHFVLPLLDGPPQASSTIAITQNQVWDSRIPKSIYPCIPRNTKTVEWGATTKFEGLTYYLLGITAPGEFNTDAWERSVIALDAYGCLVKTPPTGASYSSLAKFVPKPVAQQLALGLWQQRMREFGSKEKLEAELHENAQPGEVTYVLFAEDVWALQQLGVRIPERFLDNPYAN